jgi:transcriptional regulator with XRE-family HTH domain
MDLRYRILCYSIAVTINQAVRALRRHVKKTQQIFATELGISISALNNYERKRIPEPKQLLTFERAAIDAGRHDLAKVFEAALREALGLGWTVPPGEQGLGILWSLMKLPPRDEFEQEATRTVLNSLRGLSPPAKGKAIVDAIGAAIGDPERALWFMEEAARRNLVHPRKKKQEAQ